MVTYQIEQKMNKQASLNKRVQAQLGTLSNRGRQ